MSDGHALDLDALFQDADRLPAFPPIVHDLLARLDDPFSVPDDFEALVARDPVMASRVLRFANSAFYGFPREIISLREAVVILGLDTLKSIVLAISSAPPFKHPQTGYGLGPGALYSHVLVVAVVARALAKRLKRGNRERFFVAGLLHDIGKLLLDPFVAREQARLGQCMRDGGLSIVEAERLVLGFDHAWVGGKYAESSNLPEFLVHNIAWHHQPDKAPLGWREDAAIIAAANLAADSGRLGMGRSLDEDFDPCAAAAALVPVPAEELAHMVEQARAELPRIAG